jgi:hypothetical protein
MTSPGNDSEPVADRPAVDAIAEHRIRIDPRGDLVSAPHGTG